MIDQGKRKNSKVTGKGVIKDEHLKSKYELTNKVFNSLKKTFSFVCFGLIGGTFE
jgi:hypothetical protein